MDKNQKAFTVQQIAEYKKEKRQLMHAIQEEDDLQVQIAKTQKRLDQIANWKGRLEGNMKGKWAELESASGLFNLSAVDEQKLDKEDSHYVTHARKERMFGRLVREFRETNPEEPAMSFGELTKRLKSKYGVQCRSVSNFFKSQLERQTLEGGTRNRRIVLEQREDK